MNTWSPLLLAVVPLTAAAALVIGKHCRSRKGVRGLVRGLLGLEALVLLVCIGLVAVSLSSPVVVRADEGTAGASMGSNKELAAALSTGLACIGCAIAVAVTGAAAIGAITEKPEVLGRTLIFVGLAEGIAIYGLIISFMILTG